MTRSGEGESFAVLGPPGTLPKLDSIFDVSAKFLAEFRLWLEQNPPSIGINNILGYKKALAVGTSISGFGANTPDGAQGLLRLGSSPYELVPVNFDATSGKWSTPVMLAAAANLSNNTTAYGGTVGGLTVAFPWASFDTAGLKPQVRISGGLLTTNAAALFYATVELTAWTKNTTTSVVEDNAAAEVNTASLVYEYHQSAWCDTALAVKDGLNIGAAVKTQTGGNNGSFVGGVEIRWISK